MRLSFLVVILILSFSTSQCLGGRGPKNSSKKQVILRSTSKDSASNAQTNRVSSTLRGLNPLKLISRGKSRRPRIAAPPPPALSSEIPSSDAVQDNKRIFEENRERTLMPFFGKETTDDSNFRVTLELMAFRTVCASGEDNEAATRDFLEKFYPQEGTASDEIEPDEDPTLQLRCITDCNINWGYVLVPEKGQKDDSQSDFLFHGKVIPVTRGEPDLTKIKKGWRKRTELYETKVPCVCKTNEEFSRLLDAYGIDSEEYAKQRNESWVFGDRFLRESVANTDLELISHSDLSQRFKGLMEEWKVPLSAMDLPEKYRSLKEFRGESDDEADLDYWEGMKFYRENKSGDSPTSEEYLKGLIENMECTPEQNNSKVERKEQS